MQNDTNEYQEIKRKIESCNKKCINTVRNEMFPKYLKENDDYRLNILCKSELLLKRSITESEGKILGGWTKVIPEVYKAFEIRKNDNEIFNQESEKLDKIANSAIEYKLDIVKNNKAAIKLKIADGFLSDKWGKDNEQTIFYLHGAFHLIENSEGILKITSEEFKKMVDKIKTYWDKGFEPLTVLESTSENKVKRINQSPYLTKCLNELKNLKGTLVTHGVSFMSSDQYIINTINNNDKLEKIYIGCFGRPSEDIITAFKNKAEVVFFDTQGMF